ncbi:hypothetical protein THL1_4977 [Pseudomonas sp. TCU-HL1]|nr:hypothetical protein THL1_4977 [Pseudomonas sp. TCU-HL1]
MECRYCRGLGKVYDCPPKPFAGGLLLATLLHISAALAAGYFAATYNKHWEPTHNLILGAMVAVAVYWVLMLKGVRELVLWGMALAILYHLYQAWLQH